MSERKIERDSATGRIVSAGLIAAAYAALTYIGFGIAYGPLQLRFAEALMLLPALTPAAIPGLTLGCLLSNLGSAYGIYDWVIGSLATLISVLLVRLTRKIKIKGMPFLSPLFPALINGLAVGGMIAVMDGTPQLFPVIFLEIFISEFVICYALGLPLYAVIKKLFSKKSLTR